jgi:signal transduction histidine kinase
MQREVVSVEREVVGSMAHLALATGRTIALTGAERPVMITGNAAAIVDALRNLVENALAHTAPGMEVIVDVCQEGALSVLDSGPGIPVEDRPRIFDRFWRERRVRTDGAGLGLAIGRPGPPFSIGALAAAVRRCRPARPTEPAA